MQGLEGKNSVLYPEKNKVGMTHSTLQESVYPCYSYQKSQVAVKKYSILFLKYYSLQIRGMFLSPHAECRTQIFPL